MGLLFASGAGKRLAPTNRPSDELLHKLGCRACPLNRAEDIVHPKMDASGSDDPLVYILGEAPGREEDLEGRQFVGPSGDLVRPLIPARLRSRVRWNNVLSCRPPDNRDPEKIEVECCRPRVVEDIERMKPKAVFGLGAFPLSWTDKPSGIELWRGRRFPVQIGTHKCWYYAMRHPSFILHTKRGNWPSDDELALKFDLRRAFAEVEAGLPEPVVHTPQFARSGITCLTGSDKDLRYLLEFLDYAGSLDVVGVDDETQNLRPYRSNSEIVSRAVATPDETVAFAWRHRQARWSDSAMLKLERAWVKFLNSRAKKAVHNAAFEIEWDCYFYGRELAWAPWECTQVQAYVLDERVGDHKPGALALEFLTLQYFGINIKKLTVGLDKRFMMREPLDVILPYNGIDSKYHLLLHREQERRIREEGLEEVYREKLRQTPTVVLTQLKGVPTDPEETRRLEREYAAKVAVAEAAVRDMEAAKAFRKLTGADFNPGSSQDVIVVLRDILKTRDGQPGPGWSTTEKVLNQISDPIAKGIVNYRKVTKLKSTYVDPYTEGSPDMYDDGLHPSLGTTFTETGRLNAEGPNIQNQPVRSAEGKKVRRQVKSKIVASLDAGQIDARMIACGSRDKTYVRALFEDYDIHAEWARRLALRHPDFIGGKKNLSDPGVMGKFRSNQVKNTWVFALFYGASLRTTAGRFGVDESVLKPEYEEFWRQFSNVKAWQDNLVKQFETDGHVQMLGGLRRRAPLGKGQIVNSPVQGATNRIVMHGMNRLSETRLEVLQPNMQVHDDLTYCFNSEHDYEDNIERIVDTMLDCREFDWICVPLVVELKEGPTWADQEKVGTFSSVRRLKWPVMAKEFQ
ncbi:MAG: hypothetical protein KGO96_10235 [Elusimicrobia bacterium]|nr:hypothetical protein [Elusimicrobiota bacterium]